MYEGRTRRERESLTLSHTALAHSLARKFSRRLRRFYEYEDLVAYGQEALWQASGIWDPDGGASFLTYGHRAVLHVFLNLVYHWNRPNRRDAYSQVSLDETYDDDPALAPRYQIPSPTLDPEALTRMDQEKRLLQHEWRGLELRDRHLLAARFEEGVTLDEFGKILGVTRERVRQLELRAIDRLRDRLLPLFPELRDAPEPISAQAATDRTNRTLRETRRKAAPP